MPLPSCRRRWQQYQAHQLQPHCCTILLPFAASSPLPAAPSVPQRPALSTSSKATPLTAPSAAATAAPSSSPSAAPPTAPALLQFQQHHRLSLQHLHSVQHRRLRYPPRECCTTRLTDCAVADCLYHALWPERRVGSKNALSPFSTPLCLLSRISQILLLLSYFFLFFSDPPLSDRDVPSAQSLKHMVEFALPPCLSPLFPGFGRMS